LEELFDEAVPQVKRFADCFPMLPSGFEPRLGHVGFVVDKVALGQAFSCKLLLKPSLHIQHYHHPILVQQAKFQVHPVSPNSKKRNKFKMILCWWVYTH
jgi:hypothetical protein